MKSGARIAGGQFGGRRLAVAPGVRPTSGRTREALASIWGDRLDDARLLDCFAGSGAFAVELLGRGVSQATLIDRSPKVLALLRRNLVALGDPSILDRVTIQRLELPAGVARVGGVFDLVFADPPYAFEAHAALLAGLRPRIAADGVLAIEHGSDRQIEPVPGWSVNGRRRYGDTHITFLDPI